MSADYRSAAVVFVPIAVAVVIVVAIMVRQTAKVALTDLCADLTSQASAALLIESKMDATVDARHRPRQVCL